MTIRSFVLFACTWALAFSAAAQGLSSLEPDVSVPATITTGETHCYVLRLAPGEHARVDLTQKTIDLVIAAKGAGLENYQIDITTPEEKKDEIETLTLVAMDATPIVFEVRPFRRGSRVAAGEYEIAVHEVRPATDRDRVNFESQKSYAQGKFVASGGKLDGLRDAVPLLESALAGWRSIGDRYWMAMVLLDLGANLHALREYSAALRHYEEALTFFPELGWTRNIGLTHQSIGWIYDSRGEYQKALEHHQKALEVLAALPGGRGGHPTVHASIGLAYSSLGDTRKALDHFEKSLAIYRKVKNRRGEAIVLHDVGQVHAQSGDYARALAHYEQALAVQREVKNQRREAQAVTSIARVHRLRDDGAKAMPMFEDALRLSRVTGDRRLENVVLDEIAELHLQDGALDEALVTYREALALQRQIGERPKEAVSLFGIARAERAAGRLAEARAAIDECLALVDSIRTAVEPRDLRLSFRAASSDYYEAQIDILMALHEREPGGQWATLAFEASERARARALVEALSEVRSGIRTGIDSKLLARERAVRARLSDKEQSRTHLLASKAKPGAIASLDRDIRALLGELSEVESDLRRSSPRYATLVAPEPLSLKDVQQNVLDEGTALLEVSLGENRSYLWAVTREGITVRTLPARAEIDALVRRALAMATAQDEGFGAAAKRLRALLFAPVASMVKNRRVVIVPDGSLHYVPFAAVIPDREIVELPSATVLAMMRRTSHAKRPAGVVAVVADPVFRADDPRVEVAEVTRSAASDSALPRLRFSRREAETVGGMVPAGKKIVALDFDASRAVLRRVGDYRIVHFATHALVDDVHPQLSSLVLSTVDARGREANGHVPLYEIYNLDLGSELVVLSACQTALGKEMRGEGIVSLTHGFMYAGAPRVLSTLWRIDDRATAELMKHFYAGMLRDRLTPAAALHRAQRTLAKDPRWSAPYYWAGFVLQGEWR